MIRQIFGINCIDCLDMEEIESRPSIMITSGLIRLPTPRPSLEENWNAVVIYEKICIYYLSKARG